MGNELDVLDDQVRQFNLKFKITFLGRLTCKKTVFMIKKCKVLY